MYCQGVMVQQTHLGVVVVHEVEVDPQLPHTLERIAELEAERGNTYYLHYNAYHQSHHSKYFSYFSAKFK